MADRVKLWEWGVVAAAAILALWIMAKERVR